MDVTSTKQEAEQPGNTNNTATDDVTPRIQPSNGVLKRHRPRRRGGKDNAEQDIVYKECMKNHAASIGGHALDGCREFMPSPASSNADPKSLTCDACGCHRNFHRRCRPDDTCLIDFQPLNRHQPPPPPPPPPLVAVIPLAAAAPSGSPSPQPISSRYYSPAMRLPTDPGKSSGRRSGLQKRFRTKFSQVQKEKMLEFAEKAGWRMQRSDLTTVRDFCDGIGVDRNVFKVWMHNNKNTLGKRSGGGGGGAIATNGAIGDFAKDGDCDGDHDIAVRGGGQFGTNGSPSSA